MSLLLMEDVRKSYKSPDGGTALIIDVPSFSLEESEQMGLAGSSGSGKTTFLNLIAGILAADSGRIFLAGEDMAAAGESRRDRLRAAHLGYVFQTFNLLQGYTALENVELGMRFGSRGVDEPYAKALLERVGLGTHLNHLPRQLSVGQQQRVAVARALSNHPKLVLADEPTGNLDRKRAFEALTLIREICHETGAALLLVSHDPGILSQFELRRDLADINRTAIGETVALDGGTQ